MFLALGSGTTAAFAKLAVVAAIFHLFTHAFFKALLFLGAGSVMHAMGNVIDMRSFGGLRHRLKTTHWTFLCGALSLAGFPILSGFWSKDDILSVTFHASGSGNPYHSIYFLLFVSAVATAALTAFYTFRAYFLTFWGDERIPPEAGGHAHESPPIMLVPLAILAVGAAAVGLVVQPMTHWFDTFLMKSWGTPESSSHEMNWRLMALSSFVALLGIGSAWWMYVRRPGLAGRCAQSVQEFYQLSLNKFHFDELYYAFIVAPFSSLARFCRIFDLYVLDSLVDLLGHVPRFLGFGIRLLQNGLVQYYALAMVLGMAVFLLALMRALAG